MAYPSVVATLTNPLATNKLNSPSHSTIETNQNTEVVAIETFVGTLSSTVGTLVYDIRAAASNGGGHVQSANKGGTGQTSFNKGDIIVASSQSVLSKLAIGADGTSPVADSSQSTGIGWSKVSATIPFAQDSGSGSVFAINPVPCVLSYSEGQIYAVKIANANTVTSPALSVSSLIAHQIQNPDGSSVLSGQIPASSIGLFGYSSSIFQLLNPLIGGTTKIGSFTPASGTGAKSVTGVGFKPSLVVLICSATSSTRGFGWTVGYARSSSERGCAYGDVDTNGNAGAGGMLTNQVLNVGTRGGAASLTLNAAADFTSMDSDGFTLNYTSNTQIAVGFIAFK